MTEKHTVISLIVAAVTLIPIPAWSDGMSKAEKARETALIARLKAAEVGVTDENGGLGVHWANTDEHFEIASQLERLTILNAAICAGQPELAGPELRHIRGHKKLREIDIHRMPVPGTEYAVFPTLPNLEVLGCSPIQGAKEALTHIGKCKGLRKLSMYYSDIPDECLESLRNLDKLEELTLNGTPVSSGVRVVRHMKCLRVLSLEKTHIDDDGLAIIGELPKLEELFVGSPNVTDAGVAHLVRCTRLKVLSIDSTKITSNGLMRLGALSRLEHFYLSSTKPDAALLQVLSSLKRLDYAIFSGDGISIKTRSRLAKLLPKSRITWSEPGEVDLESLIDE